MIGRVAFDLVLGIAFRGVMHMTFVVEVRGVKSDNRHRHPARLRITAYVIADFELFSHLAESRFSPSAFFITVPSLCLSCLARSHLIQAMAGPRRLDHILKLATVWR